MRPSRRGVDVPNRSVMPRSGVCGDDAVGSPAHLPGHSELVEESLSDQHRSVPSITPRAFGPVTTGGPRDVLLAVVEKDERMGPEVGARGGGKRFLDKLGMTGEAVARDGDG